MKPRIIRKTTYFFLREDNRCIIVYNNDYSNSYQKLHFCQGNYSSYNYDRRTCYTLCKKEYICYMSWWMVVSNNDARENAMFVTTPEEYKYCIISDDRCKQTTIVIQFDKR